MTENERREQIKEIRQRIVEAEDKLKALKVKAKHMGELLISAGEALKTDPATLASREWQEKTAPRLVANPSGLYNESVFRGAFDYDALVALAGECVATQLRLDDLKADLG
jgi:hypothetical protein